MFDSLLVANRGEIARRILRTAREMGIRTIAVHSDVDAGLPFVTEADEAVLLGGAAPAESYRNIERILQAARDTGAQAIHPGYGFLSENAAFARAVQDAGLIWVGPSADVIEKMGDKINARNLMEDAGVPVAAGTREPVADRDAAVREAERIGYPVMIKAAAGGGGMGMSVAEDAAQAAEQFDRIAAFAERMFGDGSVLLERFLPVARHVEVQILGLADGRVVALGERDCSVQRRNQKVAEETPSPAVSPELRARMLAAAVRAGEAVGYRNAGTVECLVDESAQDFVFLEMNTRLQVEHPITEAVTGLDLVEQQFHIAAGEDVTFDPDAVTVTGHALELRINAEDPKRFLPGPGVVREWVEPSGEGVRVDAGYGPDTTVTPSYDSLMAKLIVFGDDREQVLARAREAVAGFTVVGPKSNLPFFAELLDDAEFVSGHYDTGIVGRMRS
ncbi:ATP-grasp domain-containing protein [Nakamurella flavida]|uniref:ATP-grasp domain-containing protein n=1 Tax=Nakamurella flavida TaxID=363630 RepID=A0A938YMC2_9ACTN|nr:biotin carboxylase N-terminal domain-containing protein [Nakamurella flavida]MBM9477864.1 ATP-grasp domain-containing protein [Nakamurella flavida]